MECAVPFQGLYCLIGYLIQKGRLSQVRWDCHFAVLDHYYSCYLVRIVQGVDLVMKNAYTMIACRLDHHVSRGRKSCVWSRAWGTRVRLGQMRKMPCTLSNRTNPRAAVSTL